MEAKFYNSSDAPRPNKPVHLGAAAIIKKDNKFLLEKRADAERWAFVGGGMQPQESLEECVRREVLEETGLHAHRVTLLNVFSNPYRIAAYPDGNVMRIVTALFHVEITDFNSMICSEESRELKFFAKNEIGHLPLAETHLDIWKYVSQCGI